MAAPFLKRRAGLIAVLKNNLGIVAPKLCNIGLITKTESEAATNDKTNRRERAEALVAAIGRKIQTDELQLKAFLGILRETRVGHIYVTIIEREGKNLNGTGTDASFASNFDRDSHEEVNRHNKEKSNGREDQVVAIEDVEVPPPQLQRTHRISEIKPLKTLQGSLAQLELKDLKEVRSYLQHLQMYELVRLGRELRLNYTNLMRLKHINSKPEEMLSAMLETWLAGEGEGEGGGESFGFRPTWRRLYTSLRRLGLTDVAMKIAKEKSI